MTELAKVLTQLRTSCLEVASGETLSPAALVEPVLGALGWNAEDATSVSRTMLLPGRTEPVQYALLLDGAVRFVVQTESIETMGDAGWLETFLAAASVSDVDWVVLTDGNEYRIYKSGSGSLPSDRLLISASIATDPAGAEGCLDLLDKTRVSEGRIDYLWHSRTVETKVRAVLRRWSPKREEIVDWVAAEDPDLSKDDIRACLAQAKLRLDLAPGVAAGRDSAGNAMSDTELRIATWLQQRSFERWMRGRDPEDEQHRVRDRRGDLMRRSGRDRRSPGRDRRHEVASVTMERRHGTDRRSSERRAPGQRRVLPERRRVAAAR
ncbi:MAG: hypothetical protein ACE5HT_11860 [Gemmatimonadales bacterium]